MEKSQSQSKLGPALLDSVAISNLTDIGTDIGEAFLDTSFDVLPEFLEAIPGLGILVKGLRTIFTIPDRFFTKKVYRFLVETDKIPPAKRQKFIDKLDQKPGQKQRVGEKVLLLLNQFDDFDKATLLGQLFRAYVAGSINYDLFTRFAGLINRSHLPDIYRLPQLQPDTPEDDAIRALAALGLVYQSVYDGGNAAGVAVQRYSPTRLGRQLAELLVTA